MPRDNTTGSFQLPTPALAPNTLADAAQVQARLDDIALGLSHVPATSRALYPTTGQVQDGAAAWGGTATGTANVLAITVAPAITAHAAGQRFLFVNGGTGILTATPTLNVCGLGGVPILRADGGPVSAGDLPSGGLVEVVHDGTAFRLAGLSPSQSASYGGGVSVTAAAGFALSLLSSRVQAVAMTTEAQSVTLPDATTLAAGATRYVIANAGDRTFGIRQPNPSLVGNGAFGSDSGWIKGAGWTIENGMAGRTATGSVSSVSQILPTTAGQRYLLTMTLVDVTAGGVTVILTGGGADVSTTQITAAGTYSFTLASTGNAMLSVQADAAFAGHLDNIALSLATGTLIGVVSPGGVAELHLVDASTVAGQWAVTGRGLEPALTLVDYAAPATIGAACEVACRLTDTLSLHFAAGTSSTNGYAIAVNSTPGAGAVGAPTLVDTTFYPSQATCYRISDTQALLIWRGSGGSAYKATVLAVDPATLAITVYSPAGTSTPFITNLFSGAPVIAQLSASTWVAVWTTSTTYTAVAISVSGTTATIGTQALSMVGTSTVVAGCYRVSDTSALLCYVDDSGTAGAPYSLRFMALSVNGATVTPGASVGINDVVPAAVFPVCQLSANTFLAAYFVSADTSIRAVPLTVSGATVTLGTPLLIEASAALSGLSANSRFVPVLCALDGSRALLAFGEGTAGTPTRHVVLSYSGGTLSAGPILYGLFEWPTGGIFFPSASGFLAWTAATTEQTVIGVGIAGTALAVTGTYTDSAIAITAGATNTYQRCTLSGGVCMITHDQSVRSALWHVFRARGNGAPDYRGALRIRDFKIGSFNPVELAPSKVAFTSGSALTQPSAAISATVRICIMEFAA